MKPKRRDVLMPIGEAKELAKLLKKVSQSRRLDAAVKHSTRLKLEKLNKSISKTCKVEILRIRVQEFLGYIKALLAVVTTYREIAPYIYMIMGRK